MSVSKALRYQIFRRDGHVCQYCGGRPPDVALVVDHVVPAALGGPDTADNLTTACRDCNTGKSAVPPDAQTVEDVSDRQREFRAAMARLAQQDQDQREGRDLDWFLDEWNAEQFPRGFNEAPAPAGLPDNWMGSVRVWLERGLTHDDILFAVARAQDKFSGSGWRLPSWHDDKVFAYMAGICWRTLTEREDKVASL